MEAFYIPGISVMSLNSGKISSFAECLFENPPEVMQGK